MSSSLIVRLNLSYFPANQPAAANSRQLQSTCTQYLQHLSSCRRIWNPVKHLWWNICENSRCLHTVGYFRRQPHSWMFDRILEATLIIYYSWQKVCGEAIHHKGILDSPWFLILFIYTKNKAKR